MRRSLPRSALLALLGMSTLISCEPSDPTASKGGLGLDTVDQDTDGDGFFGEDDCIEGDAAVNAGAIERCDGIDNNCDGEVDEGVTSPWYADLDGDGFGDPEAVTEACEPPADTVDSGTDCDDSDPTSYPGAAEVCDGLDNDCDDVVDDDELLDWYADADGDGFGEPESVIRSCTPVEGAVLNDSDCDDSDEDAYPGALERCDELDNDCDGEVDEEVGATWYEDKDDDGYGLPDRTTVACAEPVGYAPLPGDCDDLDAAFNPAADESDCTDPTDYNCDGSVAFEDLDLDSFPACRDCDDRDGGVRPDALEVCNGIDDDCDGQRDDDDSSVDLSTGSTFYEDDDADGFGDPLDDLEACAQPAGTSRDGTDCDDRSGAVNPSAAEVCNGDDDDCDGLADDDDPDLVLSTGLVWYRDLDGDGFGDPGTARRACVAPVGFVADSRDCDDRSAAVRPTAAEVCNGIDDDCDAQIDDADGSLALSSTASWYADTDGDGFGSTAALSRTCVAPAGSVSASGDCNDSAAAVNPAAAEQCNGIDDDCDSQIDDADSSLALASTTTWYRDADGDSFGSPSTTTRTCVVPSGFVAGATDCDDARAAVNPAAAELCNSIDDDCDSQIDDADSSLALASATTWYRDADGDAYGSASVSSRSCLVTSGYVASATDCNDTNAAVNPAAAERCNSIDDDCDSQIDDADSSLALTSATTWYRDADGDSYGSAATTSRSCLAASGYVASATDCNDAAAATYPGAPERWDCTDTNCDGFALPVGDGRDGALTASGGTFSTTRTALSGGAAVGATSLTVASSSGFASGDLALVVSVFGAGAGSWEVLTLSGVAAGRLDLATPVSVAQSAADTVWVARMPQYSSVSVPAGQTLFAPAWSAASSLGGGLVAFVVSGTLDLRGAIEASGRGYLGGGRTSTATQVGVQGQGSTSTGARATAANGVGGGGGHSVSLTHADGGGGGHGTAGAIGGTIAGWGNTAGAGGGTAGTSALTRLLYGGGGGGGSLDADAEGGSYGGGGGAGGGMVLFSAQTLYLSGAVRVDGAPGENGYNAGSAASPGGGGGGAGGSVWIGAASLSASSGSLSAAGAIGGLGSEAGSSATRGGTGGVGRIRTQLPAAPASSPSAYATCP